MIVLPLAYFSMSFDIESLTPLELEAVCIFMAVQEKGESDWLIMDIKVYLDRINFEGKMPLKADLSTLQVLQNCHQTSVPFENFDALKGTITNLKV